MDAIKYLALDLHISTITIVMMNAAGRILLQQSIQTSAAEIRRLLKSIRGKLIVTFEEGTLSQWAYEIIEPLVYQCIVCNPRRNKTLAEGSKGDVIDARKLADLLRTGMIKSVYHGQSGTRVLKELVSSYLGFVSDCVRVMSRIKAIFRSRGIRGAGRSIYYQKNRQLWLNKLDRPEKRQRAELLFRQLDQLMLLRRESKKAMLQAARAEKPYAILSQIPGIGPIRTAIILAIVVTPHRFRNKRLFWTYCGLSVILRTSSDYEISNGHKTRIRRKTDTRGLTRDFNHLLKYVFKGAAEEAIRTEPFKTFYRIRIDKRIAPEMVRLTVARKIASLILILWKRGIQFDQQIMLNLTA